MLAGIKKIANMFQMSLKELEDQRLLVIYLELKVPLES